MALPSSTPGAPDVPSELVASRFGMAGFLLGAMGMFGVGPSAGRLGDLADALAGYVPGLVWQHWGWPGVVAVTLTALGIAVAVSLPGLGRRSAPLPRRVTPASSAEPPA